MRHRIRLFAVATIALTACGGGDDPSGPSARSVGGNWNLAAPTITGGGLTCSATGLTMSIAMSSATAFSGSHSTGVLTCSANGQTATEQFQSGPIINGTLNGAAVSFNFDDASVLFTGTLNAGDATMSGTTTLNLEGTTFTGTWTATKQGAAAGIASLATVPAGDGPASRTLRELLHSSARE